MRAPISRQRLALAVLFLGLASLAVLWEKVGSLSRATAQQPAPRAQAQSPVPQTVDTSAGSSDYSRRVVAYIFDSVPITREDLGEYLISRYGTDRLENLVNRRIIEHVCRQQGIDVTNAEVDADLQETIRKIGPGVTPKDFETKVLKPRNKTMYEWKEDAVRPEIMMKKLCQGRVHVTEEDIQKAFEAYYGEKVECRIILWPKKEYKNAMSMYGKIRDSEQEFEQQSRMQASPTLAARGGLVDPIGHNTTGNEVLEKAAFSLRPNELSQLLETPEGYVVVKCVKHLPPDTSKKLEDERDRLTKEVFDKKLRLEIPNYFRELREKARPKLILKSGNRDEDLIREVRQELQEQPHASSAPGGR